jgi:hypothetical protein
MNAEDLWASCRLGEAVKLAAADETRRSIRGHCEVPTGLRGDIKNWHQNFSHRRCLLVGDGVNLRLLDEVVHGI